MQTVLQVWYFLRWLELKYSIKLAMMGIVGYSIHFGKMVVNPEARYVGPGSNGR